MLKWLHEGLNRLCPAGLNLHFGAESDLFNFQCRYILVCYTAVFSVVTQPQWGGALRDDSENGFVAYRTFLYHG